LQCSHADIRPACELHTHGLWESHADPDRDSNGHADSYTYTDSNTNSYSYSYANSHGNSDANAYCEAHSDTKAASYAAAAVVAVGKADS